jgi:hypothetical protein
MPTLEAAQNFIDVRPRRNTPREGYEMVIKPRRRQSSLKRIQEGCILEGTEMQQSGRHPLSRPRSSSVPNCDSDRQSCFRTIADSISSMRHITDSLVCKYDSVDPFTSVTCHDGGLPCQAASCRIAAPSGISQTGRNTHEKCERIATRHGRSLKVRLVDCVLGWRSSRNSKEAPTIKSLDRLFKEQEDKLLQDFLFNDREPKARRPEVPGRPPPFCFEQSSSEKSPRRRRFSH